MKTDCGISDCREREGNVNFELRIFNFELSSEGAKRPKNLGAGREWQSKDKIKLIKIIKDNALYNMNILKQSTILLILISINGCYTIINNKMFGEPAEMRQTIPVNSIIDERLIGSWEKKFMVMDCCMGRELLNFTKEGFINYKKYYGDSLSKEYQGEFRTLSDTLFLKFYPEGFVEIIAFTVINNQIILQKLESPYNHDHDNLYFLSGGFTYVEVKQ